MIRTIPNYIFADNLNFIDFFKLTFDGSYRPYYSSNKRMFFKSIIFIGTALLIVSFLFFALLMVLEIKNGNDIDFSLITLISLLPLWFLPICLVGSYVFSVILKNKDVKRCREFIEVYVPNAKHVYQLTPANFIFIIDDIEYELATSSRATADNVNMQRDFILATYFIVDPAVDMYKLSCDIDNYLDTNENCKYIDFFNNCLIAKLYLKDGISLDTVGECLSQMLNVMKRFKLDPVRLDIPERSDLPIPKSFNLSPDDVGFKTYANW